MTRAERSAQRHAAASRRFPYPAHVYWEWFSVARWQVRQALTWLADSPTDNPVAEETRVRYVQLLEACAQLLEVRNTEAFRTLWQEERAAQHARQSAAAD